jgi:amino acid adenylation domain-containing protein
LYNFRKKQNLGGTLLNPFEMMKASSFLSQASTPLECLAYWAQKTPTRSALSVLNANGEIVKTYTFSKLYETVDHMAAWLEPKVKRGERVVLMFENTASFAISFLACLRLGVIGVPAPLRIDPRRIANIVADCGPQLALYEEMQTDQTSNNWREGLGSVPTCCVPSNPDRDSFEYEEKFKGDLIGANEPAILQYTSGTTSTPKGVVVTQANVMANFRLLYDAVDMDPNAIVVSWLPVFHDMGLFGGLLQAPLGGGHSILLPRTTTLRNPLRWLEVISKFRATHSGAPNFAFDACVHALGRSRVSDLDLSSWRVAWNAAEPVQPKTLVNFARAFAPFGLRAEAQCPIYGIAEATLFVSGSPTPNVPIVGRWKMKEDNQVVPAEEVFSLEEDANLRDWVSSGSAQSGTDIRIVDPHHLDDVGERTIGEIWVTGPQVAGRYWSNEIPFGTLPSFNKTGSCYLRTGDLGFLSEGNLYITGRLKDVIIWHGRNISPQDIEQLAIDANQHVTSGYLAAFSLDDQTQTQIVLVIGQKKGMSAEQANEIRQDVIRHVAQNLEITLEQVIFVPRSEIERTSSGKVRRRAIRTAFIEGRLEFLLGEQQCLYRSDNIESSCSGHEKLSALLAQLEDLDQTRKDITLQIDFSQPLPVSGYDSLKLLLLSGLIEEHYNTVLPYEFFYENSADALANWLAHLPSRPRVKPDHLRPLSPIALSREQAALYFFEEDDWRAVVLLPLLLPSHISTDEILLTRFKRLIEHHPILNARVMSVQGSPAFDFSASQNQDVNECVEFVAPSHGDEVRQIEHDLWLRARRPLDIRQNAAIRLVVGPNYAGKRAMVFAINHLVCDGRSLAIIIRDFFSDEETQTPNADITAHYALIAEEEAHLCSVNFKAALCYWQKMLHDVPVEISVPWPNVPHDHTPKPSMPVRRFALPDDLSQRVKQIATDLGVGAAAVYMSAWQLTLSQMGVATPCAVSMTQLVKSRLQQSAGVGYGVRPTPLRMDAIESATRFCYFVQKVQGYITDALNHEAAPYPKIIEHLDVARGGRYAPFMQFQFGYAGYGVPLRETLDVAYATNTGEPMGFLLAQMHHVAQANLQVFDGENARVAMLVYDPQTVHEQTAKSLETLFLKILGAMLDHPQAQISQSALCPFAPVKGRVFGTNKAFYPVHFLARKKGLGKPDRLALIESTQRISHRDLWAAADQLSCTVQARLAGKRGVVAIYLPRSSDLVVAQMAILQTGNTCLPIDIKTPSARVFEMLADADTALVVTREGLFEGALGGFSWLDCKAQIQMDQDFEPVPVAEKDAAIIIYTSGSTGRAKGVVFPHGALSRRITNLAALMDVQETDRVLAYVSPGADPSIQEYWMALTQGATLVIAPQGQGFDPEGVVDIMAREKVTHGVGLPVMLHALVDQPAYRDCHAFKALTCGGELLTDTLRDKVTQGHKMRLINVYGATETTICATTYDVTQQPADQVSAVGFPMDNTEVVICNEARQPLPTGVVGEILIGGLSLALGYIRNPLESEKRFVTLQTDETKGQYYRTGDLGWLDETGLLRFVGRIDHQVKISGYRVEPDEIALRLSGLCGVMDAFVCAQSKEDADGLELLAYAVLDVGSSLTRLDLKRALDQVLPPPLRPAAYVIMDKFPMTTNGKVDRKALPEPKGEDRFGGEWGLQFTQQSFIHEKGSAASNLERLLTEFWVQALGQDDIKPFDNFFELGGHSLLAFQIVSKIEESLGVHIPANTLYRAPTICELGAEVNRLLTVQQSGHHQAALHVLRDKGALAPLFIVSPGISGDVAIERLWPHFENERPIYRLSYPALGEEGEFADLTALIQHYVDAIKSVASAKPIYIAGYSTGGIIAYETVQRVEKAGIAVGGLILLDSLDVQGSAIGYRIMGFLKTHPFLMRCLTGFKVGKSVVNLLHDKRLLRQMGMIASYHPQPWNGRAAFLKCRDNIWLHKRRAKLWRKPCSALEEFDVAGDHTSVFHDGNVQKLAKKMMEIIRLWEK